MLRQKQTGVRLENSERSYSFMMFRFHGPSGAERVFDFILKTVEPMGELKLLKAVTESSMFSTLLVRPQRSAPPLRLQEKLEFGLRAKRDEHNHLGLAKPPDPPVALDLRPEVN